MAVNVVDDAVGEQVTGALAPGQQGTNLCGRNVQRGHRKGHEAAGGRGTTLMGLDDGDVIEQWTTLGAAGLMLDGIYRNRETQRVLSGAELADYAGKRARKGKVLALKFKQLALRRA